VDPQGSIILVRGRGVLRFLLRTLCQSPADHVRIALGDGRAVEADPHGVRLCAAYQPSDLHTWTAVPPSAAIGAATAQAALAAVGWGYGWQTFPLLTVRFVAGLARAVACVHAARDTYICSALAAECARSAGWDPCPGIPTALVTPGDLVIGLIDTLHGVSVPLNGMVEVSHPTEVQQP
jgi:hypothetical protein